MTKEYEYTGNSSFESAYHDCKLVDTSIVAARSCEHATTDAVLYYMDRILEALDKQVTKEVVYSNRHGNGADTKNMDHYYCPACGRRLRNKQKDLYCGRCGQKLNWDV